jgi:hypothetical protein
MNTRAWKTPVICRRRRKLISEDRVWIGPNSGRRTDQGLNMRIQQANFDALKAAFPEVKWFTDARDRLVKFTNEGTDPQGKPFKNVQVFDKK